MGNLVINTNKINTNVIPNIKKADAYIKTAKTYATSMYGVLPKNFSSITTALNIRTEVEYLNSDIEKLLSFFQSKVSTLSNMNSSNSIRLRSIMDYNILQDKLISDREKNSNEYNGTSYGNDDLNKIIEKIMSDSDFKYEIDLAQKSLEKSKEKALSDARQGTVAGFHQSDTVFNNLFFVKSSQVEKEKKVVLQEMISVYNKWKDGNDVKSELVNAVKKYSNYYEAANKFYSSNYYYNEEIAKLKEENDDYNKEIKKLNEQYRGSTDYSYLNGIRDPDTYAIGKKRIDEYLSKVKPLQAKVTENSNLIASYNEQIAYSDVEKLYNSQLLKMQSDSDYAKIDAETCKKSLISQNKDINRVVAKATDEEIKLMYYYKKNHGADETLKFIKSIEPRINKHFATEEADKYKNKNVWNRFGQGTGTSVVSGCECIANAFTGLSKMVVGDDSYTFSGAYTQALNEIQNIETSKALNYWYSGVQSTVSQSPGVIVSFVPYAGQALALGYSAAYSAGNSYVEDVNAGKDANKARNVAIINAGVELISSALLGSVPVEGTITKSAKSALAPTGNRFVTKTMNFVIDVGGEILEEEIQNQLTLGIKNIAYGEHNTYSIESAIDTAWVTGISTILTKGISKPMRVAQNIMISSDTSNNNNSILESNVNNDASVKNDTQSALFDTMQKSNKLSKIQRAVDMAKRVGVTTGSVIGIGTSILYAGPLSVLTIPFLGKPLENSIMGNYIKNSNFGVYKNKKSYVDDAGVKHKVDTINQLVFDTTVFKGLSLPKDCKSAYFMANALNAFQQLKVYDTNGSNQVYQIDSHAMTKKALKMAEKLGYIKLIQENNLGKTSFKVEKLLMGNLSFKDFFTPGKAQATKYQMLFELTGKKLTSYDVATIMGKDFFTYNAIFDVTTDSNNNMIAKLNSKKLSDYKATQGKVTSLSKSQTVEVDNKNVIESNTSLYKSQVDINNLITELKQLASLKGMTLKELGAQKGSSEFISQDLQRKADTLAQSVRKRAETSEPIITQDIRFLEDKSLSNLSFDDILKKINFDNLKSYKVLVGLGCRLKGKDSLFRKILTDSTIEKISLDDAANKIGDSVRYTLLIDEKNYVSGIENSLNRLVERNYKVKNFKNFWGNNDIYKGVNVSLESPNGIKFELQFHTVSSFDTKENKNHVYYEIMRNNYVTPKERYLAIEIQKINQQKVSIPEGIIGYSYQGGKHE